MLASSSSSSQDPERRSSNGRKNSILMNIFTFGHANNSNNTVWKFRLAFLLLVCLRSFAIIFGQVSRWPKRRRTHQRLGIHTESPCSKSWEWPQRQWPTANQFLNLETNIVGMNLPMQWCPRCKSRMLRLVYENVKTKRSQKVQRKLQLERTLLKSSKIPTLLHCPSSIHAKRILNNTRKC